ncbi:MAG: tripartite tricarboxylate transporter substrate binding protein, partial [Betaproteobacteria bacterium]|nr:tripartite tricarboxylate transporter substrate binding protein [Betaproteobacteria bacterium]
MVQSFGRRSFTRLVLGGATLACTDTMAQAYPSKPIRLIIGFPPGGGADAVARPIAEALSKQLGQAVIVDNKPGGGTTIAA